MRSKPKLSANTDNFDDELTNEEEALAQKIINHVLNFPYVKSITHITALKISDSAVSGLPFSYPYVYTEHYDGTTGMISLHAEVLHDNWVFHDMNMPAY